MSSSISYRRAMTAVSGKECVRSLSTKVMMLSHWFEKSVDCDLRYFAFHRNQVPKEKESSRVKFRGELGLVVGLISENEVRKIEMRRSGQATCGEAQGGVEGGW